MKFGSVSSNDPCTGEVAIFLRPVMGVFGDP